MPRVATALALCLSAAATAVSAHPHIFIDTTFDLRFDEEGQLVAVEVEWSYDAFYSMLTVEEAGLDADGDGVPEQERLDAFAGTDVDWAGGFPGDFDLQLGGTPLALETAEAHEASYQDGSLVTRHVRPLEEPVLPGGEAIIARAYDPTYFVAYDVPTTPDATGPVSCTVERTEADTEAAQDKYGELLAEIDETEDPFETVDLPDIGILFADTFVFSCAQTG